MSDLNKKLLAPIAALGLALTGCNDMSIRIDGEDGVPLSELDMSGGAPTGVALLGPDTVIVTQGDTLDIKVEGEAAEAVRFTLSDNTLGVMREDEMWNGDGKATIRVTMPAPKDLNMAGSGRIEAPTLADRADINIAGSGSVVIATLATNRLDVAMAGSGSVKASGTVERLDIAVLGSGQTDLSGLEADNAEVSIAGSGDVMLASNGRVEANIAGSGDVTVTGSASCELNSVGSGKLRCQSDNVGSQAVTDGQGE